MLSIIVVFRNNLDFRCNQEWWIESHTELTNQVKFSWLKIFQEFGGPWRGDSTKITYELIFGHTNPIINDFNDFAIFIVLYFDLQFRLISEIPFLFISYESNFIKSIWSIRDQFSKEDFFLGIERVNDDIHQSE